MGTSTFLKIVIALSIIALIIVVIVLIATSLKRLEAYEVGVKYDTVGRKLNDDTHSSGLYSGPPGFEFVKFPAIFKSINFDSLECYTYDGAQVIMNVQYQYKPMQQEISNIIKMFRDHDSYLEMLKHAGKASLLKSCGSYDVYSIVADRAGFANISTYMLRNKYSELMALMNGLQFNNIKRPDDYEIAQKDKEAMRENIQVKEKERPEKLTAAEIGLEQAYADYNISIQEAHRDSRTSITRAEAEAEAVRKASEIEAQIYLKAMEAGFSGDSLMKYIGVETIAASTNPVQLAMSAPAKVP